MKESYIKLFRKFKEWEWYDNINVKVIFLDLLLDVNYVEKKWRWITVKPGEIITSIDNLSKNTGLSNMQVRTVLKKLKLTNEITIKTSNNFTLVKVNNWDSYQWNNIQDNKPITNEQQTDNNQITTTKERKEYKKEKNNINNKPTKIKIFEADSFFYKLAKDFLDFHLNTKTPSVLYQVNNKWENDIIQEWAEEVRKLHDIDKFTKEQIKYIFDFTKKNDFWSKQILSVAKFRKKNNDWVPYFVVMINEAKKNQQNSLKSKRTITYG